MTNEMEQMKLFKIYKGIWPVADKEQYVIRVEDKKWYVGTLENVEYTLKEEYNVKDIEKDFDRQITLEDMGVFND